MSDRGSADGGARGAGFLNEADWLRDEIRKAEAEAKERDEVARLREQLSRLRRPIAQASTKAREGSRPSGHEWTMLVRAHRATGAARPKQIEVANRLGWENEQPLRDLCRRLGIEDWRSIHAFVASEPE